MATSKFFIELKNPNDARLELNSVNESLKDLEIIAEEYKKVEQQDIMFTYILYQVDNIYHTLLEERYILSEIMQNISSHERISLL